MKKLVRKLSTRKPEDRQTLTTTSRASPSAGSQGSLSSSPLDLHSHSSSHLSTTGIKSPSASGTQPGFIPFGTTLHFRACPHTTPPTPRPSSIPPVLLTQVSSPTASSTSTHSRTRSSSSLAVAASPGESSRRIPGTSTDSADHESGVGSRARSAREAVVVNQFFTVPRQCFDCSLSSARAAQRMAHEAFDAKIRRGRLRIGLSCADLADLETQLRQQQSGLNHKFYTGGSGDDTVAVGAATATINARINGLRGEISQAKDIVRDWVAKRDEQVQALWDEVRASWDGAVREVVRDDGSGEGLERCVFRVKLVSLADADAHGDVAVDEVGGVGVGGSDMEMEGGLRVRVVWEMIS